MKVFMVVGITGRSGSGKSSVRRYYETLGYPAMDGDAATRELYLPGSECLAQLADAFGGGILAADGTLLRKKLGQIAFSSQANNDKLVAITHPFIIRALTERVERAKQDGHRLFFADGAMIVGSPFAAYCDRLVLVVSDTRLSLSRIMLRDGISKTAAQKRLDAQLPEETLRAAADFVIENNATEEALRREAGKVLAALLREVAVS